MPNPDPTAKSPPPQAAARSRPTGIVGGHTVQDWEQPQSRPRLKPAEPSATPPETGEAVMGTPYPAVQPIYLTPVGALRDPSPAAGVVEGKPAVAQGDTLADAITREVAELLAQSLHASVTAAVRSLAPRLVVSLSEDPAPADAAAAGPSMASDVGSADATSDDSRALPDLA